MEKYRTTESMYWMVKLVGIIACMSLCLLAIVTKTSTSANSSQIPMLVPLSAVITSPVANISLPARPAAFGPLIPRKASSGDEVGGFTGSVAVVGSLACDVSKDHEDLREKIAVVLRGGCGFYEKLMVLQQWGAVAAIVGDDRYHRGLLTMFSHEQIDLVEIPSVFVSRESYDTLEDIDIVTITMTNEPSPILDTVVFLLISPLCSLTLIYVLLIVHRRYRILKDRAPKSYVDQLPTRIWTKPCDEEHGDETIDSDPSHRHLHGPEKMWVSAGECIICLEDYVPGVSKVMKLPCGHEFHADCISKWLVFTKRTCPICKHDVTAAVDETTPLMINSAQSYVPSTSSGEGRSV